MERENPKPGERYRHFKGNLYQIITVALHAEDKEELVVYQALYPPFCVYARPVSSFFAQIDIKKYPNAQQACRFVKVTDLKGAATSDDKRNPVRQEEAAIRQKEKSEAAKEEPKVRLRELGEAKKEAEVNKIEAEAIKIEAKAVQKKNETPQRTERQPEEDAQGVNPVLLEFLDAGTIHEKVNILRERKNQLDDKCITDLATVMDLAIEKGDLDMRYQQLLSCLEMLKRFEVVRR